MPVMAYAAHTQVNSLGMLAHECIFYFHYCTVNDSPNGGQKTILSPLSLAILPPPDPYLGPAHARNVARSGVTIIVHLGYHVKLSLPHLEVQLESIQLTSSTSGGAIFT